jgi:hypothetical protein
MPGPRVLIALAVSAVPTVAQAQATSHDPKRWRPVVYADLQLPNETTLPYASLWADELKRNNDAYRAKGDRRWLVANAPASESHVVIRSPERVIALSVLHTLTACRALRTDTVTRATLKSCPMRLVVYQGGTSSVSDAGRGCFIEYGVRTDGGEPDMVRNASLTSYDTASRTIRAGVVFAGQAVDECQFHVAVPRPREENSR